MLESWSTNHNFALALNPSMRLQFAFLKRDAKAQMSRIALALKQNLGCKRLGETRGLGHKAARCPDSPGDTLGS